MKVPYQQPTASLISLNGICVCLYLPLICSSIYGCIYVSGVCIGIINPLFSSSCAIGSPSRPRTPGWAPGPQGTSPLSPPGAPWRSRRTWSPNSSASVEGLGSDPWPFDGAQMDLYRRSEVIQGDPRLASIGFWWNWKAVRGLCVLWFWYE